MAVLNRIADFAEDMTAWRRDIHAHPEIGFEEHRTSAIVAEKLESWGIAVTRNIAGTGLVGTLKVGDSSRAIGLRADMDALPMDEAGDIPHRSQIAGRMHGCGHDGHTTMLLGAARYLAETRNFDGTVNFIFQPAEEGGGGGRIMVEEGLFERFPCDQVFGIHNDSALPVGTMGIQPGTVNAASDRISIHITGIGGHAARPHNSIDPVVVGAHIVIALQTLVARRIDPIESAVLSLTQFHAGSAGNVIPETGWLNGTVRTLKPHVQDRMEELIIKIATTTAAAHGAEAVVEYERGYPPVVNAEPPCVRAAMAAEKVLGAGKIVSGLPPRMGGEDFSYMAIARPGCFARIGQAGAEKGRVPAHNPKYDFNDEILPIGASYWATLVEQELVRG